MGKEFGTVKSKARSSSGKVGQALYDYRWRKYRLTFLAEHPLCALCLLEGRYVAATVVHHKVPHKGDYQLFWDRRNHEAVCKDHHDSTLQAEERGVERPLIGDDGWPIEGD